MITGLVSTSVATGAVLTGGEMIFRNTQDIINATPNAMKLPITGFKNPNYHSLLMTEGFLDALRHNISVKKTLTRMGIAAVSKSLSLFDGFTVATISSLRILDIINAINSYYSLQFYGVQPISSGRGMTMLKDNRISDFGSGVHRILSPYEYIIFNHPVHATYEGVVDSIVNTYEDNRAGMVDSQAGLFRFIEKDDYLGNLIRIKHKNGICSTYAGLKKNSMYKKVGDRVEKGEMIARVGASGWNKAPHLIYFLSTEADITKLLHNFRITYRSMLGKWDGHFECPLIKYQDLHDLDDENWDVFKTAVINRPKYEYQSGRLHEVSLIKQYPEIKVE